MPSGGKGSSPAGVTTTTSVNPTQQSQLPFLTGSAVDAAGLDGAVGWNQALNLALGNPYQYYPGQTLATQNPYTASGYHQQILAAENANGGMLPAGNAAYTSALNGGMGIYGSPAFSGLSDIASGSNAIMAQNAGLANASATNPYSWMLANLGNTVATAGNPAYDELRKVSSGAYLNSNPYVDQMFGSASDAVTRAYQTATAPQTASNFSGAGRYGSGAYASSVSQNQQDLGSSLGNLSANIYGGNYQAERARQDAASQALGALIAQNYGLQGNMLNAAGSQYLQGQRQAGELNQYNLAAEQNALNALQGGYQAGNTAQLNALSMFPSMLDAQYSPARAMVQAGQGLTALDQAQIDDAMRRFYGEIQAPWKTNEAYLSQVGQPATGSGSVEQPYFQNQTANLLGTGLGGLSLYNGLNTAFGKGAGTGAGTAATTGFGGGLLSGLGSMFSAIPFFSDRRLKRDIEPLGTLPNGLPIHAFRYLWDDEPQIGLMADEVECVHPDAVLEGPFGFRMVNYQLAVL